MGRIIYGSNSGSIDIEDRALAHVRIVTMNKLRRGEPFMFDVPLEDSGGHRTYWFHPEIPLQFQFYGSRSPAINRAWIDELMRAANGTSGLVLTAEPVNSEHSI